MWLEGSHAEKEEELEEDQETAEKEKVSVCTVVSDDTMFVGMRM